MENDLISRGALLKELDGLKEPSIDTGGTVNAEPVLNLLIELTKCVVESIPAVDAVSRQAFDQILWELDIARLQLKEHNIPFGGVAPDVVNVVRCKDCKFRKPTFNGEDYFCTVWDADESETAYVTDDDFCSYGERMVDDEVSV